MAETQLSSERCRHALRSSSTTPSPTNQPFPNPIITTGLTGTTPASTTRPQRSLNCGLRALLAPSPTSSLSTGLLAHSFLVRCACRPRLDVNIITFATISQQSQRAAPPAPPTQWPRRRMGESVTHVVLSTLYRPAVVLVAAVLGGLSMPCQAWLSVLRYRGVEQ
jgi:hypothetical protein